MEKSNNQQDRKGVREQDSGIKARLISSLEQLGQLTRDPAVDTLLDKVHNERDPQKIYLMALHLQDVLNIEIGNNKQGFQIKNSDGTLEPLDLNDME